MLRADKICFSRDAANGTGGMGGTGGGADLLADVSLSVAPAQLVKIIGGNGCGKTTLLKILCLLLPPDSGALYWADAPVTDDADAYRERVLYIGHGNALAGELTPLENLRAAAGLRARAPKQPLEQALAAAGLGAGAGADAARPCHALSAGQKRRAALARLQAFSAELWLLDEPLAALDADGRAMLGEWLAAHLAAGGMAVCTMHRAEDWDVPAATVLHCTGGAAD